MTAAPRFQALSEVPLRAEPRAFADLLDDLAKLAPRSTGALVYGAGANQTGMVLIEHGEVCWATVAGMGLRLRALLAESSEEPDAGARVEDVFRACLRDRKPFGDALVAGGVLTAARVRAVFQRQTTEALLAMAAAGAGPIGWIPRHTHSYDAPFVFSAAKLFVAASEIAIPQACDAAREERAAVLGGGIVGMSFLRDANSSRPTPLGMTGEVELDLGDIWALGRWALGALATSPSTMFASAALDRSAAMIAWSYGHLVHVALCTNAESVSWVLARLERDRCAGNLRDERQR